MNFKTLFSCIPDGQKQNGAGEVAVVGGLSKMTHVKLCQLRSAEIISSILMPKDATSVERTIFHLFAANLHADILAYN